MSTPRRPAALEPVLAEAESVWGVGPRAAVLHLVAPVVVFLGIGSLRFVDKQILRDLTREDGVLEWIQVLFFAVGAVCSALAARRLAGRGQRGYAALWAIAALGLVFVTGEELAWGQRLFGFEAPEEVARVNEKQELSLHNIEGLTRPFFWIKVIAGAYALIGAIVRLVAHAGGRRPAFDWILIPAFAVMPFLIVLGTGVLQETLFSERLPVGYSELQEVFLAWGMGLFPWLVQRRLRAPLGA